MKPHPRIRKAIKWGGLALTVVWAVLWGLTMKCGIRLDWPGQAGVWIHHGIVIVDNDWYHQRGSLCPWDQSRSRTMPGVAVIQVVDQSEGPLTTIDIMEYLAHWGSAWRVAIPYVGTVTQAVVPLHALIGVSATLSMSVFVVEFRSRRRVQQRVCAHCNYDRTGLHPGAPCPECGTRPTLPANN